MRAVSSFIGSFLSRCFLSVSPKILVEYAITVDELMDEVEVSVLFEELFQLEDVRVLQSRMNRCLSFELLLDLLLLHLIERSNYQFLENE